MQDREAAREEALSVFPDLARDQWQHQDHHDVFENVRDAGRVIDTASLSLVGRWIDDKAAT